MRHYVERHCPECRAITHNGEAMYACETEIKYSAVDLGATPSYSITYFPQRVELKSEDRLYYEWEDGKTYIIGVVSDMIDNSKLPDMPGVKVEFISGAQRVEKEIPDYSGIPPFILRRLANIFEEGRVKYGERNWTRGLPTSSTMNHLIEHLQLWMEGDKSEDHLAKAMWGIVCLMYTMEHHADLHDADWSQSIMRTDAIYKATK